MRGVPIDLPLTSFAGCTLDQICIGQFELQFRFSGERGTGGGSISVEGGWELQDSASSVIESEMEHSEREHYTLHVLLGRIVSSFSVDAPDSFQLVFDSGHRLSIFDDNDHYETFSVIPAVGTGGYI
jgi:hypothetical protein